MPLLAWASKATLQTIVDTWRPGHSEHAPLLVRLENGREIFFETINEATSPKRFFAAFIAVGGISMPAYSEPQVRLIVSALVRAAQLSDELDERDFWEDTGATFLRACLTLHNTETITVEADTEAGRKARYNAASRYAAELGRRNDDQLPCVLVAVDAERLLVPRGSFLTFANRRRRG